MKAAFLIGWRLSCDRRSQIRGILSEAEVDPE